MYVRVHDCVNVMCVVIPVTLIIKFMNHYLSGKGDFFPP